MRSFDLNHVSDLEKIRNLSGNDTIFLNVSCSFHPEALNAIDLQNFSGMIHVNFNSKYPLKRMVVYVDQFIDNQWIFKNVTPALIILSNRLENSVSYYIPKNFVPVFDERDFLSSKRNQYRSFHYHLSQDVVCHRSPKELFGKSYEKLFFVGNGQTIYFPKTKEWIKFLNSNSVIFQGVTPLLADQIIAIQSKEDLEQLRHLTNGLVVVVVKDNLQQIKLKAISLKHFLGTMVFYGNHHTFHDVQVWTDEEAIGLFSSVHPASSLKFHDLVLRNVSFDDTKDIKHYGAMLGARERIDKSASAHFMPGGISFSNCHVQAIQYPKTQVDSNLGYFVGFGDDAIDFVQCYGVNGLDSNMACIHNYVGKEIFYLTSFCENIYEKSLLRKR